LDVMEIHSRIKQNERTRVSDCFRIGSKMVLLSSDVSARGVDYPDVTLVLQVGAPTTPEVYVQRLGRTGRAGKSGVGMLLLCEYEKGFLQKLKGIPIAAAPAHDPSEHLCRAQEAAQLVDEDLAVQTYRAWISAMVGLRKSFKWSKQDLVTNANLFAQQVLGRDKVPPLQRDLVVTMGLSGLDGLNVMDSLPYVNSNASIAETSASIEGMPSVESCASLASLQEEVEVVIQVRAEVNMKLMRPALKQFAKPVIDAILALSEENLVALEAKLSADGEAEVAGSKVLAAWVTVKKIKGPRPSGYPSGKP